MNALKYDGKTAVATGRNRTDTHWRNTEMRWSAFLQRLSEPVRTDETAAEYARMTKAVRAEKKDVGGFVAGYIDGGRRKAGSILSRSMLTLDMDYARPDAWETVRMLFGNAAALYSTHSHTAENPRYRLIMPLSREADPVEYEAAARSVAGAIGIEQFDDSTYQPERLMFWPSASKDGPYEFHYNDGPWIDVDELLRSYRDYRDTSAWPRSERSAEIIRREARRQGDPTEKKGIVGAFCRTYDVHAAIEAYLPDVYAPCDGMPDRYTYRQGSAAAGLVVYDGGKFAYSHHSTDPTGGCLCNAFDLVRLHLFAGADDDFRGKDDTRSPSFRAMAERAAADRRVARTLAQDRLEQAREEFRAAGTEQELDWMEQLEADRKGNLKNTPGNYETILRNDSRLKGLIAWDEFSNRLSVRGALPWRDEADTYPLFRDDDESNLFIYTSLEPYGLSGRSNLQDAIRSVARRNAFHPIREYLEGLKWDGQPRLDYFFIAFLGVENTPYARAVTRKALTAAVARIMEPGTPFDYMPVLVGPQGIGKSRLLARVAVRPEWFTDNFSVDGREAAEALQGKWIVESSELTGFKKSETAAIKAFITRTIDHYRAAYDRYAQDRPRQCVFFGTTNEYNFLRDETGNRRFWPLEVNKDRIYKSRDELDAVHVNQLWAEAVTRYREGEPLYLPKELEREAFRKQEEFAEIDERIGVIREYLDKKIPDDWDAMDLADRRAYLQNDAWQKGQHIGENTRTRVCLMEIWCECMGHAKGDIRKSDSLELGRLMRKVSGWEYTPERCSFGVYGRQRFYVRTGLNGGGTT